MPAPAANTTVAAMFFILVFLIKYAPCCLPEVKEEKKAYFSLRFILFTLLYEACLRSMSDNMTTGGPR